MRRQLRVRVVAITLLVGACPGRDPVGDDSTGADTTASTDGELTEGTATSGPDTPTGTGGGPSTTSTTTTTGSTGPDTTGTTGAELVCENDDGPIVDDPGCSIWTEEPCAPDEKCMPFQADPGCIGFCDYDFRCLPVVADPGAVGEPCEHLPDDHDSCARGLVCVGSICTDRCACELGEPTCPIPNSFCQEDFTINYCVTACDPLAVDCPQGWPLCESGYGQFVCQQSFGAVVEELHAPCESHCAEGMECRKAPQCGDDRCCVAFCEVDDPQCPLMGQTCQPYEFGLPPPDEVADIGVCIGP